MHHQNLAYLQSEKGLKGRGQGPRGTKTDIAVAVGRGGDVTKRRPASLGVAGPTAAAQNPGRAGRRTLGIGDFLAIISGGGDKHAGYGGPILDVCHAKTSLPLF